MKLRTDSVLVILLVFAILGTYSTFLYPQTPLVHPRPMPGEAYPTASGIAGSPMPDSSQPGHLAEGDTPTPTDTTAPTDTLLPPETWTPTTTSTDTPTATASATPALTETPTASPHPPTTTAGPGEPSPSATQPLLPTITATITATRPFLNTMTPTPTALVAPTLTPTELSTQTATPTALATAHSLPAIRLNEFLPYPDEVDWNDDGTVDLSDQWIEIISLESAPVDVGGWALDDSTGGRRPYIFPAGTILAPGSFLVRYRSTTEVALNRHADTVRLLASDGTEVDRYSYAQPKRDRSYSLMDDGVGGWTDTFLPSPGRANLPATPTKTPTATPTAAMAFSPTPTASAPATPTLALMLTPTDTPTPTPTGTLTVTLTPTMTGTLTPTGTITATGTLTITLTPTATLTATVTLTPTLTTTPTWTPFPVLRIGILAPQATPPAPPPAPTNVPGPSDPHVSYSAGTDKCAACHRSHTATGQTLRKTWPEENLCFGCHTSGGSGANVQPAFTSYGNTASGFYKHDISAVNGVHRVDEGDGAAFGGGNRHVECEDCHSPHKATRGAASPPMLQRVMNGEAGVDPVWSSAGAPAGYNFLAQAEREYQVCFKCHSGFTSLPSYSPDGWNGTGLTANGLAKLTNANAQQIKDSRDLAQEFNPNNASFHPVAAQGRNQAIPAGSWVPGWSQTSMTYCSDCHNNANSGSQGVGPHGSPLLHVLVGAANNGGQVNYTTVTKTSNPSRPSSQELCFKCHSAGTYLTGTNSGSTTNFRKSATENLHLKHSGASSTCYSCHDTHGSEQERLINFELGPMLSVPAGRNTQTAWFAVGTQHGCALTCHGKLHNGDTSGSFRYP